MKPIRKSWVISLIYFNWRRGKGIQNVITLIFYPGADKQSTGFTIRTPEWRYTEWVPFTARNNLDHSHHWDQQPLARELYDIKRDFFEGVNLSFDPDYSGIMQMLSERIRAKLRRD